MYVFCLKLAWTYFFLQWNMFVKNIEKGVFVTTKNRLYQNYVLERLIRISHYQMFCTYDNCFGFLFVKTHFEFGYCSQMKIRETSLENSTRLKKVSLFVSIKSIHEYSLRVFETCWHTYHAL